MPSRAVHPKSRHGCTRCKRRRVKCNEAAPCQNCIKRNEVCSLYLESEPSFYLPQVASRQCPETATDSKTWGTDLFLMSHFTSVTVQTIISRTDMVKLWQTVIIEDAASRPFLLHGILALSALHLASLRASQRNKYAWYSQHHLSCALSQYRLALQDDSFENIGPVLSMAILVTFITMAAISDNALPKEEPAADDDSVFMDIFAFFTTIRGARPILELHPERNRFRGSSYGVVMSALRARNNAVSSLPAVIRARYQLLRTNCLCDLITDECATERAVCSDAIDELEKVHTDAVLVAAEGASPDGSCYLEPLSLMRWVAIVSPEFIRLLQNRHTAALVIMGEFAVLFQAVGDRWYMSNWVNNVLNAIRRVIAAPGLKWLRE